MFIISPCNFLSKEKFNTASECHKVEVVVDFYPGHFTSDPLAYELVTCNFRKVIVKPAFNEEANRGKGYYICSDFAHKRKNRNVISWMIMPVPLITFSLYPVLKVAMARRKTSAVLGNHLSPEKAIIKETR